MNFIKNIFSKLPVALRWPMFVVLAFTSFISFVNVNSAFADAHHANGILIAVGIVLALVVVAIFAAAAQEEKQIESDDDKKLG
jgi:Na+/H+ antiporter NhaB